MKSKITIIATVIAIILIGGAIMLSVSQGVNNNATQIVNNVSIVDGKQVITINAKGGYFPKITTAKAGLPTILKVATSSTFDCSSALTIPSLNYRSNLPPSGETMIDLPLQSAGSSIRGLCAMGMYHFVVNFN